MASTPDPVDPDEVEIRYTRLPDRMTAFRQRLIHTTPECVVTFMERTALPSPVLARGRTILESGAPVVWFTFPGLWHDIGRFHLRDGRFTGWYANILTPVRTLSPGVWETTDLFLDVWLDADGGVSVLDEDELEAALEHGVVTARLAAQARQEAERLVAAAAAGAWPPPITSAWTLARVRESAGSGAARHPRAAGGVDATNPRQQRDECIRDTDNESS